MMMTLRTVKTVCAPQQIDIEADNQGQILSSVSGCPKYSKKEEQNEFPKCK